MQPCPWCNTENPIQSAICQECGLTLKLPEPAPAALQLQKRHYLKPLFVDPSHETLEE